MRLGILTFHRSYNYGAFMQCYSLCSKIRDSFPNIDVEVIDYSSMKSLGGYDDLVRKASPNIKQLLIDRNKAFLQCQEVLPLSPLKIVSDDPSELFDFINNRYDCIIVGSDAVWNWTPIGFPNAYFLKEYSGIKMSYAASAHGLVYQNMNNNQIQYVGTALSDFYYIGVRDITTENLVKYVNSDLIPVHNCDPTMYLELEKVPYDKEQLIRKMVERGVDFGKPIIGIMAGESVGYEIKKNLGNHVQLVALYSPNKYADVYLNDLTPFEWAHVFSFFKATVTHFFHGTMLSLVNHVPVIPVEFIQGFSAINTTKIKDLMTRLDLLDWRFEINLANRSILQKILEKSNFHFNTKIWKQVNKLLIHFITEDYSVIIRDKVLKERESANSFFNKLKTLVERQNNI